MGSIVGRWREVGIVYDRFEVGGKKRWLGEERGMGEERDERREGFGGGSRSGMLG